MSDDFKEFRALPFRKNTDLLMEMVESGVLDKDQVIVACLKWMSDHDVGRMAQRNEFFPYPPDTED